MKKTIRRRGIQMIEVKEITNEFGRKKVLRGVTFRAHREEITSLIGVNGAGKTTLLKAVMGLIPIDRGSILLNGKKVNKKRYEKITFIPDAMTMPSGMHIVEAMTFMKDFYDSWNDERAIELLHFFQLEKMD